MIELLKGFPDNVAAFAYHGHVTKADYDQVLIPDFEDRLIGTRSCGSTSRSRLTWRASTPARSGRIRNSASATSSTGNAAQWSPMSPGRNTSRSSARCSAFSIRGSTGRFQKLKPTKHENGLLKQNSERLAHLITRTHQRGIRCKNLRAITQLRMAPPAESF